MNRFELALWNRACAVLGADVASRLILCERRADEASTDAQARVWIDEAYAIRARMEAAEAPAPALRVDRISKARAKALHAFVRPAAKALGTNDYTVATRAVGRGIGTFLDLSGDDAEKVVAFALPFHAEG